ncbi:hypothetical protein HFN_1334 [Helicobacter fennelliae MRY12-0050]|uniref:Uncharacterized protein n=1 Tax=Helicobacter fennelliae MRY12-0050 TaxID=1325130 RepID=T1D1J5_9HELI|nr:hypothetical protein HFN_1334 [Helicobacter fennelliae MRY12-0050]
MRRNELNEAICKKKQKETKRSKKKQKERIWNLDSIFSHHCELK